MPGTSFSRISNRMGFWLAWLIGVCGNQVDNRQAIFAEDASCRLNAFFIDHGHLFGGPHGLHRLPFVGCRYLASRIYPDLGRKQGQTFLKTICSLDVRKLWENVQALPDDWKTSSALNSFAQSLPDLSDANRLLSIVGAMINDVQLSNIGNCGPSKFGPKSQSTFLQSAPSGRSSGRRLIAS